MLAEANVTGHPTLLPPFFKLITKGGKGKSKRKIKKLEMKRQFKLKKVYHKSDIICQNFSAVQHAY